MSAYLKSCNIK